MSCVLMIDRNKICVFSTANLDKKQFHSWFIVLKWKCLMCVYGRTQKIANFPQQTRRFLKKKNVQWKCLYVLMVDHKKFAYFPQPNLWIFSGKCSIPGLLYLN